MIRNHTDRHIVPFIAAIFRPGKLTYLLTDCTNGIHIKNGFHILHYHGKTL